MKSSVVPAFLAIACGAPGSPAVRSSSTDPQSVPRIERIERGLLPPVLVKGEDVRFSIEERMREHKVPAVSIAVVENYKVQWFKAYGLADVEDGARATEETIFLAGSISKSVNALGVLMAVADGTLTLDGPINDSLTSWKLPDNDLTRASPVTVRKLLSHTAGTTVHGFPGYAAGEAIPTVQQILDGEKPANTLAVRVDLAPGAKFRYSGGGTTITQLALADRSKRPYQQVLADRVLGPLEMTRSTYEQALPPHRSKHAAAGYGPDGKVIAGKRHIYPEMAAAGLWTTPADLARFFIEIALARAGRSSHVTPAIAMQMTTKVSDVDGGNAVGLGVFLTDRNGAKFFGHGGDDAGFQASALISLDGGYGVFMMANSNNGFQLFEEIERAVFAEYGWKGADPEIVRVAMEPAQRSRFAGRFVVGNEAFAIGEQAGKLVLRVPFADKDIELVPVAADRLVDRAEGRQYRIDASGSMEVTRRRGPAIKPARLDDTVKHHLLELDGGRFDDAVAAWRERVRIDPKTALDDELRATNIGYRLLERGREGDLAKGTEVLRLIVVMFPESSNGHDSLGDAYMRAGDKPRAIAEYELALATLDADPRIPRERKAGPRKHAEAQLAKLRAP